MTTKDGRTILSKEKTIDVAKIIKNEQRLQERVVELEKQLIQLNDSIQHFTSKINQSLNTIERLGVVIEQQQNQINLLNERELNLIAKKSNNGFYGYINLGLDFSTLRTFDFGLQYVREKNIYSFGIDITQLETPFLKLGYSRYLF